MASRRGRDGEAAVNEDEEDEGAIVRHISKAACHCPPRSHALMAALTTAVSAMTPKAGRDSNTSRAFCHAPSRESWLTIFVSPGRRGRKEAVTTARRTSPVPG
jgi:hypothetical protein